MKIAYVFCPIPHHGRMNGIISQCLTWADGLRQLGHSVFLTNSWETYEWNEFDIIHIFGSTDIWFYSFIKRMLEYNRHIIWSPICDNVDSTYIQFAKSLLGCQKVGILSLPYMRRLTYGLPIRISVRSNHERDYIAKAYHVKMSKFDIVPLGMSYDDDSDYDIYEKENFCLHISTLYQPRKNVIRLVKAAVKYNFKLVLAGTMGTNEQFNPIKEVIADNNNIHVLGRISEKEKIRLYKKAKVFALPSISEGVGIVALDAAHYGCDIVITNVGGPQEYYSNLAWKINPYSIDDIGKSIISAMTNSYQPDLKKYVDFKYSKIESVKKLLLSYTNFMNS